MSSGIRYITNFTFTFVIFLNFATPILAMNEEPEDARAHEHAIPSPAQPATHHRTYRYKLDPLDMADADESEDEEYKAMPENERAEVDCHIRRCNIFRAHATKVQNRTVTPADLETFRSDMKTILETGTKRTTINTSTRFQFDDPAINLAFENMSLLGAALRMGDFTTAEILIELNADVNAAIYDNNTDSLLHTILIQPSTIHTFHKLKDTARCTSETCNYTAIARFLLDHKADIEKHNAGGQTPLVAIASHACPSVIRLLLDNKADVNARDHLDFTAIQYAAAAQLSADSSLYPVARLLLEYNADITRLALGKKPSFPTEHADPHVFMQFSLQERNFEELQPKLPEAHELITAIAAVMADEKLCRFLLHTTSPLLAYLPSHHHGSTDIGDTIVEYLVSPDIVLREHRLLTVDKGIAKLTRINNILGRWSSALAQYNSEAAQASPPIDDREKAHVDHVNHWCPFL